MGVSFAEPEVAKKKSKTVTSRKPMVVQLRGAEEWKAWVEELAEKEGDSLAKLFERGVRLLARNAGHREPPRR